MSLVDLTNVSATDELLPAGQYNVSVEKAEVKETKSGTGQYINVTFTIIGGENNGRKLFHMFNIKNENAKAVEIGLSQLKSFMLAAGAKSFAIDSVTQLHGLYASAKVVRTSDSYGDKNVIKGFTSAEKVELQSESALPF